MHKQHEDQPSNELPNLSTWHRVPIGATIPAGTPYAYHYEDEGFFAVKLSGHLEEVPARDDEPTYYTEHPITPPLPTEEGATIVVSSVERPPHILLTREAGRWVNRYGMEWVVDDIRVWAPVTIGETVEMRP